MTRTALPYRRRHEMIDVAYPPASDQVYTISVGFDEHGQPREVFADGHKEGSSMQAIIDDLCILISIALQHDVSPADLLKSLGRCPAFTDGQEVETWASVAGAIVDSLKPQITLIRARTAMEVEP